MTLDPRDEALVKEWLIEWEERRERGEDVAAATLVGDRSDLVPELQRRMDALTGFQ